MPAAIPRLTPNFVPKMPSICSKNTLTSLNIYEGIFETNEGIFGTKFGVSLGIAAGILFQKCPQFVPKIPSLHSTYLRAFL
jgi:hypothetical protein